MTRGSIAMPLGAAVVFCLAPLQAIAWNTKLDLNTGYRIDRLRWHIAANASGTATPNILSELAWDDLRINKIGAAWQATDAEGLHFRAVLDYGSIDSGRNQDSDYLGNNRTLEFSRSNNESNGDNVSDLAFAFGHRYVAGRAAVTPLVGISRHAQNLRITNGNQTIPATGPFPGLDSTYKTEWTGPFVGAEFVLGTGTAAETFVRFQYHWSQFDAVANWNLRSDFQHPRSFEHEANGRGRVMAAGVALPIGSGWLARIAFDYQKWDTYTGIDRVFFSDGSVAVTRLNEVEWTSRALSLGLELRF